MRHESRDLQSALVPLFTQLQYLLDAEERWVDRAKPKLVSS